MLINTNWKTFEFYCRKKVTEIIKKWIDERVNITLHVRILACLHDLEWLIQNGTKTKLINPSYMTFPRPKETNQFMNSCYPLKYVRYPSNTALGSVNLTIETQFSQEWSTRSPFTWKLTQFPQVWSEQDIDDYTHWI